MKKSNTQKNQDNIQKDEMWERIFEAVPDLIMILDTQHKILQTNKAMAERLGKSPKELVGQICYEIVHDTKEPPAFCPHARLLNDGKEHSSDAHEERLDGDFLITVSPLHDSDGSLIGSVHVARNVTELKKSERALLESEKKFRNLADQSPNMIFINAKGKIVYANKKCEEVMGYAKQEFYSPNFDFRKLIAPESKKTISDAFKNHMAGKDVEPYEYGLITKDGRTLTVINAPKLITYEGEDSILGIVTDITDRVQMEQQLKEARDELEQKVQMRTKELVIANEQLLKEIEERKRVEQDLKNKERSLAEAQRIAHLGNWDWNIVTNELFWSDEIYRIFGLTPQEFGATYEAFLNSVHPDDRNLVDRSVDAALQEDKPYSIDHRIVLPDGSEHIVHEQAEVIRDDAGQAIRMAGTVQDITERKKAEADRRQLGEELTHVSRITTIGTLAGALAHEINQPLTAIMSNAQAALRFLDAEKPNLDELREILSDIADDTIRSSDVIHQLRDFMKKGEIELIPLNINETIKEVVNLTHRDAESKNISVRVDTNEDLPEVMGDKVQLQQVILNLVINGFDAMMYQDAGSRELVIQTEQDENNSIHVAVQDTGMGIEEEKLEQIFEPFVSTKPEGMGLGLSINQYIINAHNGHMWATNNPRHGATVHFTLPIKK